jgi:hypothetical protein
MLPSIFLIYKQIKTTISRGNLKLRLIYFKFFDYDPVF